jgi:1,4-dihydroxy-6-naphthoate synthase
MWWPLFEPAVVSSSRFAFEPVLIDIEAANRRAEAGVDCLEITALSCGQYPRVAENYVMTACGSSIGDGYGPKLVAAQPMSVAELKKGERTIAIPGDRTTAALVTNLLLGPASFRALEVPFKDVAGCVLSGEADAGVVIHEGQLTFEADGLVLVEDLGRWWLERTDLPLPLGLNVVRRDIEEMYGPGSLQEIARMLEASIAYAQSHPEEALARAQEHAGGISPSLTKTFVDLYVNRMTIDVGERGFQAVRRLLEEAASCGLVPPMECSDPLRSGSGV